MMSNREMIRALYLHDRTSVQIARVVGISVEHVERILDQQATKSRARKRLRKPTHRRIPPDQLFDALRKTSGGRR
jgi:DNA-directed RNA polymerase specialized sigma24 family protein